MFQVLLIFLVIGLLVAVILLYPRWVDQQRRRVAQRSLSPQWEAILEQRVAPYGGLSPHQRRIFQGRVQVFLAEKQFIGCNGLAVTEEMRVTVAAMASLLLLHDQGNYFPNLKTVLLYPSAYWATETVPTHRFLHQERRVPRLGESWLRDQLVLAWNQVDYDSCHWRDGRNVVLHEFAHQLDQAEGEANGVPMLPATINPQDWSQVMTATYQDLCRAAERNQRTVLDSYGTTNSAEFFAVATESFFEQPQRLQQHYPRVYHLLKLYYQVDPAG